MRYLPLASAVAAIAVPVGSTFAVSSVWNVANGGNWSTNWDIDYPKAVADTGLIDPSTWSGGANQQVNIDVTDITGGSLTVALDTSGGVDQSVRLNVNNNATFNSVTFNNASFQGRIVIAANKTLTTSNFTITGWAMQQGIFSGGSVLKFVPNISGAATFSVPGAMEMSNSGTVDFVDVTTVNFSKTVHGGTLESRDTTWKVGSTIGNQTWVVTNSTVSEAGIITLSQRSQSNPWNFEKSGANDVDMSKIAINRNSLLNNGIALNNAGRLFTNSSGLQAGGTVTIADYYLPNLFSTTANHAMTDTLGANLTIASGGSLRIRDDENTISPPPPAPPTGGAQVYDDDVQALRVLSGNTVRVMGTGGIVIRDQFNTTTGRLGIYFPGSTIDSDAGLQLLGPRTFLNDGGNTASQIRVGGNLAVESRNATGFATVNNAPVGGAAFDDFDLRATDVFMDGGGSKTFNWDTGAALGGPTLTAGDFSLANFTLDSLNITNSTALTLTAGRSLFLDDNFVIDAGSTLTLGAGARLFLLDPDHSELSRMQFYSGPRAINSTVVVVPGVGEFFMIPEPATLGLLTPLALVFRRRR